MPLRRLFLQIDTDQVTKMQANFSIPDNVNRELYQTAAWETTMYLRTIMCAAKNQLTLQPFVAKPEELFVDRVRRRNGKKS